jgi:hypothetical protein
MPKAPDRVFFRYSLAASTVRKVFFAAISRYTQSIANKKSCNMHKVILGVCTSQENTQNKTAYFLVWRIIQIRKVSGFCVHC